MMFNKRYYYKVYTKNREYITTWNEEVISTPRFRSVLNGGYSDCNVKLSRDYNNFGEEVDVKFQNRVEIWCEDRDAQNGVLVYSGFISKYTPVFDGEKSYIDIVLLNYVSEASYNMLLTTSGTTIVPFYSQDPSDIMKGVIDLYRERGGINLNYGATGAKFDQDFFDQSYFAEETVDDTGTVVSYTFNHDTLKEAMDKVIELCPENWFWFVDPNGIVYLKETDFTLTDHKAVIGRDISYLSLEKSIENVTNAVFFTGGGDPSLFIKYERNSSISTYGRIERKMQDGRVTLEDTADYIARRQLNRNETPEARALLTILDNNGDDPDKGIDIESVRVGQTIRPRNIVENESNISLWDVMEWDTDVWDETLSSQITQNLLIVSIQYEPGKITIEASNRLPEISKRIEDVRRNLDTKIQEYLPSSPSERTV